MAELVDARDLKSLTKSRAGSIPALRTKVVKKVILNRKGTKGKKLSPLVIVLIVVAVVLLVLVGVVIGAYNSLVVLRNRVEEAWSDITVQLKRRTDLIPNLVNSVKGYATHEKEVFEKVAEARSAIMNAGSVAETAKAENALEGALKSLFAVSEAYPELKANQNFLQLQQELVDTEDKIQAARRFYNGGVAT